MVELSDLLLLMTVPGVGSQKIRHLVQKFGSPGAVLKASAEELIHTAHVDEQTARDIRNPDAAFVERQIAAVEKSHVSYVSIWDDSYPELLKKIHDPPVLLFIKGVVPADERWIAVVGTRSPSSYGRRMAEKLAGDLAARKFTVVSGMARGIDTHAHQGALENGLTVAVLGCGVNVVYPPENIRLYERIQQHGAIVSEFFIDQKPYPGHFPKRNRIISGLCLGTVVIEAGEKSGALITAYMALDQGREVFALPGQAGAQNSKGPHQLIREGAKLIETAEDILEEFPQFESHAVSSIENPAESLTAFELRLWEVLSDEPKHIDDITSGLGCTTSEALALLLSMELKGCIRQNSGMMFVRTAV
jgi:DNA processing protein